MLKTAFPSCPCQAGNADCSSCASPKQQPAPMDRGVLWLWPQCLVAGSSWWLVRTCVAWLAGGCFQAVALAGAQLCSGMYEARDSYLGIMGTNRNGATALVEKKASA